MPCFHFHRLAVLGVALALSACASHDSARVSGAATAPLHDLNLVHADVPAVLAEARIHPYVVPAEQSCKSLSAAIVELDAALGADLDAPVTESNPSLMERGSDLTKDSAIDALRSTTEGMVPFRGWVRKLSGAERYSGEVAASIAAGTVRRAFLKGLRVSKPCA